MRVARIVVPPQAVSAGYAVMTGTFTTEQVADAVRDANEDVGLDPGEHTSIEFATMVAQRLIDKAVASELVVATGPETWRGPQPE